MDKLYARAVFFVRDAQRALDHYTETLGFSLDWSYEESGRAFVFFWLPSSERAVETEDAR